MARVLLVDDDPAIREVLGAYLRQEGYEVVEAVDGLEALGKIPQANLVVLDLMLPRLSGWELARELRRDYPELPVLMLTAKGEEEERIRGLDLGADDYVVKPFSPREVVARVRALLRRSGLKDELVFGDLVLRPAERVALLNGAPLPLSRLEFDLLLTLAQHPGLVWSRERLLERVWGSDFPGVDRVVDVHIAGLRKKLGEDGEKPRYIETVRGVGYRFREE
ncbi:MULTISPECIES: response regulator transcription factor [unclassified Meiothermus]|uniref:response regulator transcription factor n=1 Tax=unclassified Meiothermus TaxID=370471 RepID=UPI000D7C6C84|nr:MULTISPECIES: response regulator transcription factor [unclassified Meiothermus]PZA06128.1 DNA-binding response regulator [Meiothermus sp. Pnk-1]RYM35402.1 response regulator transcription factor [Meiothermus sp. PNK-Is4]